MRTCKKCGESRDLTEFRLDSRCQGGRRYECKKCRNAAKRARYNPEKQREVSKRNSWYARAWRYGMSVEELQAMLERQNGCCAICPKELTKPCVDHDHETGAVRGLLCHGCNTLLGLAGDDPERLDAAKAYLLGSLVC